MSLGSARRARIHYAWIVIGVAFVTFLVSAGVRATPTVLIVPLQQAFGWSREDITFAIGVQLLVYGLVGPFSAGLVERFGLRPTLVGAMALAALSFAGTLTATAPWQLAIYWGLGAGVGTGSAALVLAAIIANRWFVARRGTAMGILTGSAAAGQLIFLPLLATITVHVGWRAAVITTCIAAAAVVPVVYVFMRDRPSDMGLKPYGVAPDAPEPPPMPRVNPVAAAFLALGDAVRQRDFWLLSGSFFVCGATTFGLIGTHFIPACLDHGIPATAAADTLAAMGVCNVIGTVASGWLSDRFDSRWLLFWYYTLRGLSLLFLPYAFELPAWGLGMFGLFYGFDWITTVPPTVRLTAKSFGVQRSGIVYGWIMVMHQVGAAIFAFAAGVIRTDFGDYFSAFIISGLVCFVAAALVLGVGRSSPKTMRPALVTAEA